MVRGIGTGTPPATTSWVSAEPRNMLPRGPGLTMGSAHNPPTPARTVNPLQQAARFLDEHTRLSEKVASAKTKFVLWKQERAENARQKTCERLDQKDAEACGGPSQQPTLGSNKDVIKGFEGKKEAISNNLGKWMDDIGAHAKATGVDVAAARTALLRDTLIKATAHSLANVDTQALKSLATMFEQQGRTEKATVLKDFIGMVETSRTPQGASQLFLGEAKHHMTENASGGETFLRSTEHQGTAAVRKLMNANGMEAYGNGVFAAVESIFERPDTLKLAAELKEKGLTHTTHEIPADLARRIGDLAREVLGKAVTVPVPPGLQGTFATLKNEIVTRGDDKVDSYSRKLFSDQLILKGLSSKLGTETPLMRMVADFINKTASGTEDVTFKPEMKAEYQRVKPMLAPIVDAFFASNGL